MAGWTERRLENLEAECPARPRLLVLEADADRVAETVKAYREATPEGMQAEVLVVVRRMGGG